jgi:cytochrome P450
MPSRLTGAAGLRLGWQFARDPIDAMRRAYAAHGPFVSATTFPFVGRSRMVLLGVPLILTADAKFNLEVLNNAAVWRSSSLLRGGARNSAARRLNDSLTRMTGPRHAHYRRLISRPLRKSHVNALGERLVSLASEEVASWPIGNTIDLAQQAHQLLRLLTNELLFGGEKRLGYPIADLAGHLMQRTWSARVMGFPINLPMTPYARTLREAEDLERDAIAWAEAKRGHANDDDLVSILVNNPDQDGEPVDAATIARGIPALVAMASEACHTTLVWALLLLALHPRIARELLDELTGAPFSIDGLPNLRVLEAVVKETLRILPPVPSQLRTADCDTQLFDYEVPRRTRLVLSTFLINRSPELYPEADRFDPARWSTLNPSAFDYPVFGGGPRNCPGYHFALLILKVALASIVARYRMELPAGLRIDYAVRPTLRPVGSVPVVLRRQDGALARAPIRGTIRNLVRLAE